MYWVHWQLYRKILPGLNFVDNVKVCPKNSTVNSTGTNVHKIILDYLLHSGFIPVLYIKNNCQVHGSKICSFSMSHYTIMNKYLHGVRDSSTARLSQRLKLGG
jgi:hypothetical protein